MYLYLSKLLEPVRDEMPKICKSISSLSLEILPFEKFGKERMKKWRLSPDAICQLAFQLANFRVRGKLSMTYEAALARIFKDGRTETIRSCTPQAALFVKEMTDKTSDKGSFLQAWNRIILKCFIVYANWLSS